MLLIRGFASALQWTAAWQPALSKEGLVPAVLRDLSVASQSACSARSECTRRAATSSSSTRMDRTGTWRS